MHGSAKYPDLDHQLNLKWRTKACCSKPVQEASSLKSVLIDNANCKHNPETQLRGDQMCCCGFASNVLFSFNLHKNMQK